MTRDLKKQLKELKNADVSPREEWLTSSRDILLSQIKNTAPVKKNSFIDNVWHGMSIFIPRQVVFNVIRPVAVLLIVIIVGTSGLIATVDASYETLPGDWLYPAKRAVEKTQTLAASLLGAKNTEAKLHSEFAKRRVSEIQKVIVGNDEKKKERVSQTITDLKKEIDNVNSNLESMSNKKEAGSAKTVKIIQEDAVQIKAVLKGVKKDLVDGLNNNVAKEISEVKDMAQNTSEKAIEVLVAKHLDGDKEINKDGIKDMIEKSIIVAIDELDDIKKTGDDVIVMMEAVIIVQETSTTTEIVVTTTVAITSTTATTTIVKPISKLEQVLNDANEVIAQVDDNAVAQMDKKTDEAQEIIDSGDNLIDAVNLIKEVVEEIEAIEKRQDTVLDSAEKDLSIVIDNEEEIENTVGDEVDLVKNDENTENTDTTSTESVEKE